jgi:hypothetical protein
MNIYGILPIAYPGKKKISPVEHRRMSEGEISLLRKKLRSPTEGFYCREILPGKITGKYCREILPENIAGKITGKITGKYCRKIFPGKNRRNCGRENPPDKGKNFSLPLWASKNCCRISGTNLCNYLASTRIKSD